MQSVEDLALVVPTISNAAQQINHYPGICFNTYPVDSNVSSR